MQKEAVVLVSGGLDSATAFAIAKEQGFQCRALTFDYGQRHRVELEAAKRIAARLGALEHVVFSMDFRAIGGSALTSEASVPKNRLSAEMASGIPVTYVPARNTIFLGIAAGLAEARGLHDIFVGVNALDYSGYPDCRPEFLQAMEEAIARGTKVGVEGKRLRIHAPLMRMTKASIIREGTRLGVDYALTHSCYDPAPGGRACGACDSCLLRKRGFEEAGVPDPTAYASAPIGV